MVTHGEDVRSFAQHRIGAEAKDHIIGYNENLDINVSLDGKMTTEFEEKKYEIET